MEPSIIKTCESVERLGSATARDIAITMDLSIAVAASRLSTAFARGVMTADRTVNPRRYEVTPGWRARAGSPGPMHTKTEEACAAVQRLGVTTSAGVGETVGIDSSLASVRLKNGLKKGWLKLEHQGLRNLYSVTPAWVAHSSGVLELEAAQGGPAADFLLIQHAAPLPTPDMPMYGTPWQQLPMTRLSARAAT